MNIAILWYGEYRNSDIAMKFNNFEKLRKKHNVTDFISTWESRVSKESHRYNHINDTEYKNEIITKSHYSKFLDTRNCVIHKREEMKFIDELNDINCPVNSMNFHFKYLISKIKNKNFDLVFLLRTDVIYGIDFDFIEKFDFTEKIVVKHCIYGKEKIKFLNDLLFISNVKTIEKFVDNIPFDIEGGSHHGWSKILDNLKINCVSIHDILGENLYAFIVRYFMRKSLNSMSNITLKEASKQSHLAGKFLI